MPILNKVNIRYPRIAVILVLFFSLIGLQSCRKHLPDRPFDVRDKIVGYYEVWDSLYRYIGPDSMGNYIKEYDTVFYYEKVEIKKQRVKVSGLFIDDYWDDGLRYTPLVFDTTVTSRHGNRHGNWIYEYDFKIDTETPFRMSNPEFSWMYSGYDGYLIGKDLYLSNGGSNALCKRIK